MSKQMKQTLYLIVAMIVVYPIVIYLAIDLPPNPTGLVHMGVSAIFLVILFRIWSSFKNATRNQIMMSILLGVGFVVILPIGILLVSPLDVMLKGIAHFLLVALFVVMFLKIWYDPRKARK